MGQETTTVLLQPEYKSCAINPLLSFRMQIRVVDKDALMADAIIKEKRDGAYLQSQICTNESIAQIRVGFRHLILSRMSAADVCVKAQMRDLQAKNLHAALANAKRENRILRTIVELIDFAKGSDQLGEDATKAAETEAKIVSGTNTLRSDLNTAKKLSKLAGEVGGNTKYIERQLGEKGADEYIDVVVEKINPYQIAGEIDKLYLDFYYRDRLSEIVSFSYSDCP